MAQLLTCSSDPISLLLTTTTTPSLASAHANLLAMLRVISANQSVAGLPVHLLGTGGNEVASPNLYLNLARFSPKASWTLLFPGDLNASGKYRSR